MDAKFKKELETLAKKYNMEVTLNCLYCGHKQECDEHIKPPIENFFVTFTLQEE